TSAAPAEFVGDLKRHPDVGGLADLRSFLNMPAEVRRHYADDCRRLVIQSDLPADDLTVAAEPSLPQTIANHCNAGLSLATLVRLKRPAQHWISAQHREQVRGPKLDRYLFRFAVAGQVVAAIEEHGH